MFIDALITSAFEALAAGSATLKGKIADGASAVGVILDTLTSLTTSGAKIVSVRNAGVEKAYVDKDGGLVVSGVASGANALLVPSHTKINFGNNPDYTWARSTSQYTVDFGTGIYSEAAFGTGFVAALNTGGGYVCRSSGVTTGFSNQYYAAFIDGNPADNASAVGVNIGSAYVFTSAGAKLAKFHNGGTEKAFISKDGEYEQTVAANGIVLQSPDGTRFRLTISNAGAVAVAAA